MTPFVSHALAFLAGGATALGAAWLAVTWFLTAVDRATTEHTADMRAEARLPQEVKP